MAQHKNKINDIQKDQGEIVLRNKQEEEIYLMVSRIIYLQLR